MSPFHPNPAFEQDLLTSSDMEKFVRERTEKVLEEARRLAEPHVESGEYLESLSAEVTIEDGRVVGRVKSDSDHWPYVEFGTTDAPAQAILRRSVEGAGVE